MSSRRSGKSFFLSSGVLDVLFWSSGVLDVLSLSPVLWPEVSPDWSSGSLDVLFSGPLELWMSFPPRHSSGRRLGHRYLCGLDRLGHRYLCVLARLGLELGNRYLCVLARILVCSFTEKLATCITQPTRIWQVCVYMKVLLYDHLHTMCKCASNTLPLHFTGQVYLR